MAFTPDWLSLREPADHAARDGALLRRAAACVANGQTVLDLGSGTGSTARAFAAAGFDLIQWRFLDNDAALLDIAVAAHPSAQAITGNLSDIEALPLDGVGLVTASALLDLMPATWVEALAQRLADAQVPFYAALSFDGQMSWTPLHTGDTTVTERFNAHQRGDKGIGTALGPDAAETAARCFAAHGFEVSRASSPWSLDDQHAALQHQLLDGIASAAQDAGHPSASAWLTDRIAAIPRGRTTIGHTDILALPVRDGS